MLWQLIVLFSAQISFLHCAHFKPNLQFWIEVGSVQRTSDTQASGHNFITPRVSSGSSHDFLSSGPLEIVRCSLRCQDRPPAPTRSLCGAGPALEPGSLQIATACERPAPRPPLTADGAPPGLHLPPNIPFRIPSDDQMRPSSWPSGWPASCFWFSSPPRSLWRSAGLSSSFPGALGAHSSGHQLSLLILEAFVPPFSPLSLYGSQWWQVNCPPRVTSKQKRRFLLWSVSCVCRL